MKAYVFVDGLKKHTDERVKCIRGVKRITVRGTRSALIEKNSSRRKTTGKSGTQEQLGEAESLSASGIFYFSEQQLFFCNP